MWTKLSDAGRRRARRAGPFRRRASSTGTCRFRPPARLGLQLKNEPGLMLAWGGAWPGASASSRSDYTQGRSRTQAVTCGNIYTYANTGLSLRLCPYSGRFQDDPIRVRPCQCRARRFHRAGRTMIGIYLARRGPRHRPPTSFSEYFCRQHR